MKFITYRQYVEYSKINNILQIREPEENYETEEENEKYDNEVIQQIKKKHDKMFRDILGIKKEMARFINEFLDLNEVIKEKQITQCKTDFITRNYKNKQSDIIYKIKDKPVYFLIEHQSTIDKEMPLRMWEYVGEIMRTESMLQKTYLNEKSIYPVVIPIVIYTGHKKWNAKTNIAEEQYKSIKYKEYQINFEYNLIEIGNYTFEELLEKKSLFGDIMIIEKCINKEELEEKLEEIIKIIENEKDKKKLEEIIGNVLQSTLGKEKTRKMLEKLEGKEVNEMSPLMKLTYDTIMEDRRKVRAEGNKENLIKTVKNMLKYGETEEKIMKYVGISQNELEEIKGTI